MALPTWPVSLPQRPLVASYNEEYPTLAVSVVTGNKTKLMRRASTRAQDKIAMTFVLSPKQVGYFEQFYYDTLAGGTLRFNFTHPRKLTEIEVSIDPGSEQGFTITPYETTLYYKLSLSVIVWN